MPNYCKSYRVMRRCCHRRWQSDASGLLGAGRVGRVGGSVRVGRVGLLVDVGRVGRVGCAAVRVRRVRAGPCSLLRVMRVVSC